MGYFTRRGLVPLRISTLTGATAVSGPGFARCAANVMPGTQSIWEPLFRRNLMLVRWVWECPAWQSDVGSLCPTGFVRNDGARLSGANLGSEQLT
jgi:hypothetical protein